jgi:formylglycine-generating enzyme required for sulfatase activity/predicted Ser/Thr protein kinase
MNLPARFGKYELQEFLGGGMSHVFQALDTVIGRQVAVKVLTDEGCRDTDTKNRFLHEARMSGTIQHDHIVTIHDYGEEQGRPYMVMEFLRGGDLRDAIRKGQTGDLRNRLRIADETAAALEYVHQRGIIHRDIKPENIFLEQSGRAKIMDFGISKAAGFNLTKAGNTMGTPFYMSPEQVLGTEITPLVDVYSYGIVLYELFTGDRLVKGDSMERLFYIILHEGPDPAKLSAAGLPPALCELILRCTAKKPEARIQSFSAIREVLKQITASVSGQGTAPATLSPAVPQPPSGSSLKLGPMIGAGLGALALGAIALWYLNRAEPAPQPPPKKAELAAMIDAKGGKMALVPAGEFRFGSARSPLKLPAVYIDVTEVSNRAYRDFASATNRALPEGFPADAPGLPAVNVSFNDAKAFCVWAGKRLPDDREWEKAARGTDGRNFPWGNNEDKSMANAGNRGLAPVDSFEQGASPFKLLHMTGNAWEWVEHPHTPSAQAVETFGRILQPKPTANEPWHYIKGGAFDRALAEGVTYEWASVPARLTNPAIGFRCAQDPPEN